MAVDSKALQTWLGHHYEKVAAGVAVALLLVALTVFLVGMGTVKRKQSSEMKKQQSVTIEHPDLPAADVGPFDEALARLTTPVQVDSASWTHSLFVPPERVYCPACRKPSRTGAENCSICGEALPKGAAPEVDKDLDTLPDLWETDHGLDPANPADAALDGDADGFDNRLEFLGQSDPTTADSMPALDVFLIVKDMIPNRFNLRFQGKVVLPGGEVKYLLNVKDKTRKSYLKKMNESVEGFKLVDYQEKIETNGMRKVDVSILKLKRGDRIIPLTKNRARDVPDYTAVLGNSEVPEWKLNGIKGVVFEAKMMGHSEKYRIKEIDSGNRIVVLGRLRDGKDVEITSAAGPKPVVETTPVPGGAGD